jgi:hypothetical protein
MRKLLFFGIGISIVGVAVAQAMPFHSAPAGLVIQVADGCGIGVYRGPYGDCKPIYRGYDYDYNRSYYRGYRHGYYDGYSDGSGRSRLVNQGACSGRDMVRVCNVYGVCWATCY